MTEACIVERVPGLIGGVYDRARTRRAWTTFWADPGAGRQCIAGASDISEMLARHWAGFAASLAPGARVLDLGCGAGAVARALLASRRDILVTGVDIAKVPFVIDPQVDLLSDTEMESLPFADGGFGAVVSQFGFEYGCTNRAARELARMLAPGARFSFVVHHAHSPVVTANRARLDAMTAFLGNVTRAAFRAGNAEALDAQLGLLRTLYPRDALLAELARALPSRVTRSERERAAIWTSIEEALAPERWILEALSLCCVAPDDLNAWLGPLRRSCNVAPVSILCETEDEPIAWRVEGTRA